MMIHHYDTSVRERSILEDIQIFKKWAYRKPYKDYACVQFRGTTLL